MPWQCPNKPQKNAHGDHIAPFAKMKKNMEKRNGMAVYKISQECVPLNIQPQTTQNSQPQNLQHPQPQTLQHPQSQSSQCAEKQNPQLHNNQNSFDIPDRYAEQLKLWREWEEKIERLNEKYNLDCFSSSELDSESD